MAVNEMLRVLKPGGTIAFSTWPPELLLGSVFALVGKYSPPLAPGVSPSPLWGDVATVRQRLAIGVRDLSFDRETMQFPAMSPGHYRVLIEKTSGPVLKLVQSLHSEPGKLAQFRTEMEAILARYFDGERNIFRQDYLLTRAVKV